MKRIILLLALSATMAISCEKEAKKIVKLSISTQAEGTKATFEGQDLVWQPGDQIGVLLATTAASAATFAENAGKSMIAPLSIDSNARGIFSGSIDLSGLTGEENQTLDNLRGIVYPASNNHWSRYRTSSPKHFRIIMSIVQDQVQVQNGVMNGYYFPMYAPITASDLVEDNGGYKVAGVQLRWGCSAIKFEISGTHPEMSASEVFESITLNPPYVASGDGTYNANYLVGTIEYRLDTKALPMNYKSKTKVLPITVSMAEASVLADGIEVYMALLPRSSNAKFDKITIVSDQATYTKNFDQIINLSRGKVYTIQTDLSTYTREAL